MSVQSNLKGITKRENAGNAVAVSNPASSSDTKVSTNVVDELQKENKLNQELSLSELSKQQAEEKNEAIQNKVAEINEYVQKLDRKLEFTVDDSSGDTVVKVIDSETDKLIRQIPSDEILRIRDAVDTYRGILLETKA